MPLNNKLLIYEYFIIAIRVCTYNNEGGRDVELQKIEHTQINNLHEGGIYMEKAYIGNTLILQTTKGYTTLVNCKWGLGFYEVSFSTPSMYRWRQRERKLVLNVMWRVW